MRNTGKFLLAKFLDHGRPLAFRRGAVVFHEGERSDWAFLIHRGHVGVSTVTPSGRVVLLTLAGPGELLGELGVILGEARSATARAHDDVSGLVLEARVLQDLLDTVAELGAAFTRQLARRLRTDSLVRASAANETVQSRVCAALAVLVERARDFNAPDGPVVLHLTQDDLAAWIGDSREEVNRALSRLRQEGLVETGRGRIAVPDETALLTSRSFG